MKIYTLFIVILLATHSFAGDKGNGGDPYEVYATNFPEPQKITKAIKIVSQRVEESNLSDDLSKEVINEMISLKRNDRFRYIGNIIVPPGANDSFGHRASDEEGKFLGLGAFTLNKRGAQIHFTERTLSHSDTEFAKIVLHEVLHHLLPRFLAKDEGYVERLSSEIFTGHVSDLSLKSLEVGFYLPKGEFYKERLLAAFAINIVKEEYLIDSRDYDYKRCDSVENCHDFLTENAEMLPDNIWDSGMVEFVQNEYWSSTFYDTYSHRSIFRYHGEKLLVSALFDLGYDVPKGDRLCEEYQGLFIFKECILQKKVGDILN